jgi:hypothetical protein
MKRFPTGKVCPWVFLTCFGFAGTALAQDLAVAEAKAKRESNIQATDYLKTLGEAAPQEILVADLPPNGRIIP